MDAIQWLRTVPDLPTVMTSLPDLTESQEQEQWGGVEGYRDWFLGTVKMILKKLRPGAAAVFYQTDSMLVDKSGRVTQYLDKSFLCSLAAQEVGACMLWHKIALRNQVGVVRLKQPGYTHMCCYASPPSGEMYSLEACRTCPDVLDRGDMSWSKGTGVQAAWHVIKWLKEAIGTDELVDPFCGVGTIPAVAQFLGLRAAGVEISKKRCRQARNLTIAKQGSVHVVYQHNEELMHQRTGLTRSDLGPRASKSGLLSGQGDCEPS